MDRRGEQAEPRARERHFGRLERPRSSSISWKWFSAQPYRFHSAEQSSAEQRRRRRDDADSAAEIVRSSTVAQRASDTPQRADFPQCPGTPSCRGEEFQTSRRSAGFKNRPGQPRQFVNPGAGRLRFSRPPTEPKVRACVLPICQTHLTTSGPTPSELFARRDRCRMAG